MTPQLKWTSEVGALPTYLLEGTIGEDARLEDLAAEISRPVRLDLAGIARVNSTGVREWLRFIDKIDKMGPHRFVRCSVPVVNQLNMIINFRGSAIVESVFAPYYCDNCEHETAIEVSIQGQDPDLPTTATCPECGGEMELDEVKARYFHFLSY